jgi:hypothetical protein
MRVMGGGAREGWRESSEPEKEHLAGHFWYITLPAITKALGS